MQRRTQVRRFVIVGELFGFLGVAAVLVGEAAAQVTVSCAQIAAAAERLACYDRAAPAATPEAASSAAAPGSATATDTPEAIPVVVIGMRKYPGRSATFTTETGEVWIQIGAEGVYVPKVPFDAVLRPASMGTYFLRPSDFGWRVHVRRND